MENAVYFTYTCPVSRMTYAGHPREGHLYAHDNDLEEAVNIIHSLARKHNQPVSWVINDQEYTNQEGLLHYFKQFQEEGDAILVTMELTTSPAGVDKYDTKAVISWINDRCKEAGLRIDGLWSLKFLETDLEAIREMDPVEFAWTRNLAGSCWHQIGIDDSTWGGCTYNPYYPSVKNVRAPAQVNDPQDFLMFEWLSRDIAAILAGGFPATFALDPADSNRKDAGGFDNEPDACKYSQSLILEIAKQRQLNDIVVVNVNEEARHYQTEGHDKSFMLDGMFGIASQIEGVKRISYKDLWPEFRNHYKSTPERLFVCNNVDWRAKQDLAALYENASCQIGFLKSHGNLPVEFFDYSAQFPGKNSNDAYPMTSIDGIEVTSQEVNKSEEGTEIILKIMSEKPYANLGMAAWDTGAKLSDRIVETSSNVTAVKIGLEGCVFVMASISAGENEVRVVIG